MARTNLFLRFVAGDKTESPFQGAGDHALRVCVSNS